MERALAAKLADLALAGIDREYPNVPQYMLTDGRDWRSPRALHPAFFGCLDWHSAVHSHWTLARMLRVVPDLEAAQSIFDAFERHVTAESIRVELAYFDHALRRTFERPYGWGWLLRLAAELAMFPDPRMQAFGKILAPLSARLAEMLQQYLEKLSAPVRAGTHGSTAYAMMHAYDYAACVGDEDLRSCIVRRGLAYFARDRDVPTAYEPSGEDFISPALAEADLMGRLLDPPSYLSWLEGFLPPFDSEKFRPLRAPIEVTDPHDYRIGHLIGLALQLAAAFNGISRALPLSDARRARFARLAAVHEAAGLAQMFDSGYGGGHWLASFAAFLLTDAGPYRGSTAGA